MSEALDTVDTVGLIEAIEALDDIEIDVIVTPNEVVEAAEMFEVVDIVQTD